mmetsp:Transcript_11893/g.36998  ORF Transcript_11893/g.36998 Transcript_11893/m.36998 type:complete len:294 (-) Transcript_11893:448-1329(-)
MRLESRTEDQPQDDGGGDRHHESRPNRRLLWLLHLLLLRRRALGLHWGLRNALAGVGGVPGPWLRRRLPKRGPHIALARAATAKRRTDDLGNAPADGRRKQCLAVDGLARGVEAPRRPEVVLRAGEHREGDAVVPPAAADAVHAHEVLPGALGEQAEVHVADGGERADVAVVAVDDEAHAVHVEGQAAQVEADLLLVLAQHALARRLVAAVPHGVTRLKLPPVHAVVHAAGAIQEHGREVHVDALPRPPFEVPRAPRHDDAGRAAARHHGGLALVQAQRQRELRLWGRRHRQA